MSVKLLKQAYRFSKSKFFSFLEVPIFTRAVTFSEVNRKSQELFPGEKLTDKHGCILSQLKTCH